MLFRRIATRSRKDPTTDQTKELFLTLPQPQRNAIREKLLQCLEGEQNTQVRNKVGDAIAEIARQYTEEGTVPVPGFRVAEPAINGGYIIGEPWPELLGALFKASQSAEHGQRESAFRIFATTPGIIEKQHEDTVLGAFTNGFKDDNIMVFHFATFPSLPYQLLPPNSSPGHSGSILTAAMRHCISFRYIETNKYYLRSCRRLTEPRSASRPWRHSLLSSAL